MRQGVTFWLVLGLAASSAAAANKKPHQTYIAPIPPTPVDPLRVSPGIQIPEHTERYTWKITGKFNGKETNITAIPVYNFNGGWRGKSVGNIPVGTEVKLDKFIRMGRVIYWAIPWENNTELKKGEPALAWVNGQFIEPAAYTPSDQ